MTFFKVPFTAVPDLVARRQVLLRGGYAYVRETQVGGGGSSRCCPYMVPPQTAAAAPTGTHVLVSLVLIFG